MKHFFFLFIIFFSSNLFAQEDIACHHFDPKGRTREHTVDFRTMVLDVQFDVLNKKVFGKVNFTFSPLREQIQELILDAPGIEVEYVTLNNQACKFSQDDKNLNINFEEALHWEVLYSLEIKYQTQAAKGIYFLGWDDPTKRAREQIWTQGQGIDNRYWIPCFDDMSDKLLTETYITFQNDYEVISNGDFIEKIALNDSMTTWHYKMPNEHVVYLVMIAIGKFDYKDQVSSNGIVSRQYFYPDRPEDFEATYQYSAQMMDWMENEFGVPYPWGKIYRNVPVQDFIYGAMENTTSTIFGDFYLQNSRQALERNYIGTNAHELTHQWFGDYITEWSGTHHWLHESFATHYAKHFKRSVLGEDAFQWDRYQEMQAALSADSKDDLPVAHSQAGSSRHYPKGSIVLDMLRNAAGGDVAYQKVVHQYLKKYAYKHVDTHLFELAFMETLGLNLDWFFDQWIYRGGFPHFDVSYQTTGKKTFLYVNQIQEKTATISNFKVTIPVTIHYENGKVQDTIVQIDSSQHIFELAHQYASNVAFLLFDKGNTCYKKVNFQKDTKELLLQAQFAENMIDRFDALKALETVELDEKREVLIKQFSKENFYACKANIVKQLAKDEHASSEKFRISVLKDPSPEVRKMLIEQVDEIPAKQLKSFMVLLNDSSYSIVAIALEKLSLLYPEKTSEFLLICKKDIEENQLLAISANTILAKQGSKDALNVLVDFVSNSFEFRTRIKAIESLEKLAYEGADYKTQLLLASVHFNRRLANIARRQLEIMTASEEEKAILKSIIGKQTFNKNEEKLLKILTDKVNLYE